MVHFIVATHFEAKPLIDFFKLKKKNHIEEFQLFYNEDISLTICGIGKINAALAVTHTYFEFGQKKNKIWINVGLAGHKNLDIGELILVNKISDNNSNYKFFPFFHKKYNLNKKHCTTYDYQNKNYNESLSDMEASGFYAAANKYSTNELIHSMKIISDNKIESIDFRNKKQVYKTIYKSVDKIFFFSKEISLLKNEFYSDTLSIDRETNRIFKKINFTYSEKEQFKKILRLYLSRNSKKKIDLINYSDDAKTNIKKLKKYLKI